jgi:hypothetical protein
MSSKKAKKLEKIAEKIAWIQDQIRAMDHVASGTLLKRMKVCGKPGCRCAKSPQARHGPYYEWGRMKRGKLVHQTISPDQVNFFKKAMANYRKIRRLLRTWETETVRAMEEKKHGKT